MKIQIDFINGRPIEDQIKAVNKYIIRYTEDSLCKIKETPKRIGHYVESDRYNYHISCHKTKGGMYKFKLWLAV